MKLRLNDQNLQIAFLALRNDIPSLTTENLADALLHVTSGEKSNPANQPGQSLTVKEFARRMMCSKPTVWRMIKTGTVKSFKVGGLTRIPEAELVRVAGVGDV